MPLEGEAPPHDEDDQDEARPHSRQPLETAPAPLPAGEGSPVPASTDAAPLSTERLTADTSAPQSEQTAPTDQAAVSAVGAEPSDVVDGEAAGAAAGSAAPDSIPTARRPRFRERPRGWQFVTLAGRQAARTDAPPADAPPAGHVTVDVDEQPIGEAASGSATSRGAMPDSGAAAQRPHFRERPRGWQFMALAGRQVTQAVLHPEMAPAAVPLAGPMAVPRAVPRDRVATLRRLALPAIILLGAFLRFYHLDALPGEIFGDMVENIAHIASVLSGDWHILYGYDGREAMLYFLAAPFAHFFGDTYLTLKTVTALIGLATIPAVYLFAREMVDENVALLSAFLIAVSKWPVIFSRIGFRTVLTPLFVALTFYFLLRAYKYGRRVDFFLGGLLLGLGLYTYTGFRSAIAAVFLIFVILWFTKRAFIVENLRNVAIFWVTALVVALPMIIDALLEPGAYLAHPSPMLFVNGHVGQLRPDWFPVLLGNIVNQLLMFNVRGDIVFRVNPPFDPELDVISGILFLIGVALWVFNRLPRKDLRLFLFVPFFVLQLSSVLDLNFPIDIPSSTRVTNIIPFVYLLVATGLWWLYSISRRGFAEKALVAVCLFYIFGLNYNRYFTRYAYDLPNHNTPIGRIIAQDIDSLPSTTSVFIVGCCWGDWGQPEPQGIVDALSTPRPVNFIDQSAYSCTQIRNAGTPAFVVFPPTMGAQLPGAVACLGPGTTTTHTSSYGEIIYYSFEKL